MIVISKSLKRCRGHVWWLGLRTLRWYCDCGKVVEGQPSYGKFA